MTRILEGLARSAGLHAKREQIATELLKGTPGSDSAREAQLDLHVWSPGPLPLSLWVDLTHRCLVAKTYVRRAAAEPGAVAEKAEEEKRRNSATTTARRMVSR